MLNLRTIRYRTHGRALERWLATAVCITLSVGPSGSAMAHAEHGHPVRIHEGTCEAIGAVAFPLNGLGASVNLDSRPSATPVPVNPESAYQVMVAETTIDGSLDQLLTGEHAVMVYESDEEMDAIACGNVGGALAGEALVTGLAEAGTPGHVGFAMFQPDGDQTLVTVILGHAMTPISAAGVSDSHSDTASEEGHEHDGDDGDHDDAHAEEDHDAAATPPA
jgi:hypothetical protein